MANKRVYSSVSKYSVIAGCKFLYRIFFLLLALLIAQFWAAETVQSLLLW